MVHGGAWCMVHGAWCTVVHGGGAEQLCLARSSHSVVDPGSAVGRCGHQLAACTLQC